MQYTNILSSFRQPEKRKYNSLSKAKCYFNANLL
jgi:hypothetical protein